MLGQWEGVGTVWVGRVGLVVGSVGSLGRLSGDSGRPENLVCGWGAVHVLTLATRALAARCSHMLKWIEIYTAFRHPAPPPPPPGRWMRQRNIQYVV